MTSREFRQRLVALAGEAQIDLPPAIIEPLAVYFDVLARWNARINLTSLPLQPPSDEALRRLLLEPLEAAAYLPTGPQQWFDIGSGGGSPAIPLKLLKSQLALTMVESRARKAAFLRELIRVLRLSDTDVRCARVEDLTAPDETKNLATLITLRAIRMDDALLQPIRRLITDHGELWLFCSAVVPDLRPLFRHHASVRLRGTSASFLARYRPAMFHVEHSS